MWQARNSDDYPPEDPRRKGGENPKRAAEDMPSENGLIRILLVNRLVVVLAAFMLEIAGIAILILSAGERSKTVLDAWGFKLTTTHVGIVVIALGVLLHGRALKGNTKLIVVALKQALPIIFVVATLTLIFMPSLYRSRVPLNVPIRLVLQTSDGSPANEVSVEVVGDGQIFLPDTSGIVTVPGKWRGKRVSIVDIKGLTLASETIPVDPHVDSVTIVIPK